MEAEVDEIDIVNNNKNKRQKAVEDYSDGEIIEVECENDILL